jgi:predicted DNA repair protein MutK
MFLEDQPAQALTGDLSALYPALSFALREKALVSRMLAVNIDVSVKLVINLFQDLALLVNNSLWRRLLSQKGKTMSGLIALLDDVAGIAKVAAASVDDVIGQAAKAGSKAAGAVIDDAAVTPKYVSGFEPARELPIIWRITKGSLRNKLLFLLPAGLLLSNFAPWAIAPLLMLGGAYLCFEGAEKVAHALGLSHGHEDYPGDEDANLDPAKLEEKKAAGAIKTDFILSAEIMTIALAAIPASTFWMEAATLAAVAIMITVAVYGSVALIVKMDDLGLAMADHGRLGATCALGRGLVKGMPGFLKALTVVGTAAMLWVGGSIIVHGLEEMGFGMLGHWIHDAAYAVGHAVPAQLTAVVEWATKATIDGIFGLALGLALIPVGERIITPIWRRLFKRA